MMLKKYSVIVILITLISACSPALPGSLPAPHEFKEQSLRAEKALAQAKHERQLAEKALHESNELLDEAKKLKAEYQSKLQESRRALAQAKSERTRAAKEKSRALNILNEAKKEKAPEVAAPLATPLPSTPAHSQSDAP